MATKGVTISNVGGTILATWGACSTGDSGAPLGIAGHNDKTATVTGTATTFALEGSNNGTDWFTLHDIDMTTEITATGIYVIKENPAFIRPNVTTGTSVIVQIEAAG